MVQAVKKQVKHRRSSQSSGFRNLHIKDELVCNYFSNLGKAGVGL